MHQVHDHVELAAVDALLGRPMKVELEQVEAPTLISIV
jgi:hypothetical protein